MEFYDFMLKFTQQIVNDIGNKMATTALLFQIICNSTDLEKAREEAHTYVDEGIMQLHSTETAHRFLEEGLITKEQFDAFAAEYWKLEWIN